MKMATGLLVGLLTIALSTPVNIPSAEGAEKSSGVTSGLKAQEAKSTLKKKAPKKGVKPSPSQRRMAAPSAIPQSDGGSGDQVPKFVDMGLRVSSPAAGHVAHRGGNLRVGFQATREIPAGNVEIRVMSGTRLVASANVAYEPPASPPPRPDLHPIWTTEVYIGGDAPYAGNYIVIAQHSDAYGISDTFAVRPIGEGDASVIRRDLELLSLQNAYGTSLRTRVRNNGEVDFNGDVAFRVTSIMLPEIMNVTLPLSLAAGRTSDWLDLIPLEPRPELDCGAIYTVEMDPEDLYLEFDEGNNRLEERICLVPRKVMMGHPVTVFNASSGSSTHVGYNGTIHWADLGVSERDPNGTQNIHISMEVQNCGYQHWDTSVVTTAYTGYWPCTDGSIGECEQTGTFMMGMYRFDLRGGETRSCDFIAGAIRKTDVAVVLDLVDGASVLHDDFRFNIHF